MAGDNLKVLSALDSAKTQWYHFTAIIIAGMGFFTDAYDLFCISLVTKMLGRIYYHQEGAAKPGSLPPNYHCRKMVINHAWCIRKGDKLGENITFDELICQMRTRLSFTQKILEEVADSTQAITMPMKNFTYGGISGDTLVVPWRNGCIYRPRSLLDIGMLWGHINSVQVRSLLLRILELMSEGLGLELNFFGGHLTKSTCWQ